MTSTTHGQMSEPALLSVRDITKAFPGVQALEGVSIDLHRGEVHAVCGENGAGKSTLMRILAGIETPDRGTIEIDGRPIEIEGPMGARGLGIGIIHQELDLVPQLSVAENVFTGALPRRARIVVDWPKLTRETDEVLGRVGASFQATTLVGDLTIGQRQLVEIAKALVRSSRIVIMDEPTASLSPVEAGALLSIVRSLREQGLGILYVSHRLDEVFRIADGISVLRDGRLVGSLLAAASSPVDVVRMMVGRELSAGVEPTPVRESAPVVLEVKGLANPGVFEDVGLTVREGEIVGLYGLVGAGRTEIARAIFGLDPVGSGEARVHGKRLRTGQPWSVMACGLAYAPEDRKSIGLVLGLTVEQNIALASLDQVSPAGLYSRSRVRSLAERMMRNLDIRPPDPTLHARQLSGGNQQKVVLAKWLATDPRVIILDEPTRGIDVGAKHEIYQRIQALAESGRAVILISSELPEQLAVPHRIIVVRDGRLVGEMHHDHATEERLMSMATGVTESTRPNR